MIFSDRTETILHKSTMMLSWMGLDVSSVGKFAMSIGRLQECLHLSIESLYSSMESDTPPHRSDHRDLGGGKRGSKEERATHQAYVSRHRSAIQCNDNESPSQLLPHTICLAQE